MGSMELRHLRYFTAVADFGSFTAAARQLHISQSSISEQILDLEKELEVPLLDRSGRKVQLTAQGYVFLEEARKTLDAAQRAVERTRQSLHGEEGTLSIGFFLWGAGGFFPRMIREYRVRRIRLSLLEMHVPEQIAALEDGRIDVALTRPLQPPFDRTLRSELLYNDPIVVAVRPEHPFAGRAVHLRELAEQRLVLCERKATPYLFDEFLAMCSLEGFLPQIVNTSSTWSGVLTLVEAGEGIALVPSGVRHLRTKGLSYCALEPEKLSMGLAVVWNPACQGVALQDFLALLQENRKRIQSSGGG
jgi:DNA-binding transcriptional LysR family regulator